MGHARADIPAIHLARCAVLADHAPTCWEADTTCLLPHRRQTRREPRIVAIPA